MSRDRADDSSLAVRYQMLERQYWSLLQQFQALTQKHQTLEKLLLVVMGEYDIVQERYGELLFPQQALLENEQGQLHDTHQLL